MAQPGAKVKSSAQKGRGMLIDGDIPVTVRRSARARRMTLRVARANGEVVLTLPLRVPEADGRAFAESRAEWLRKTRARMPSQRLVRPGALIPVEGRALAITPAPVRVVRPEGAQLLVPDHRPAYVTVAAWLKHLAQQRLLAASGRYAAVIGRPFTSLALRDTRSRWGSCTVDGRLMFSWRLAMAPPAVLDYVAAHEVAHLRHMDHSAAFWAATARLMPDYQQHRDWLRINGHDLLSWQFRDGTD